MRHLRLTSAAAGVIALAALGLAAPGVASASSSASSGPDIRLHPGVIRARAGHAQPPTTAQCEAAFSVACYQAGQVQQAYGLPALYQKGVTGKGQTIVIVDSFGSPSIAQDLATFDAASGIAAPPSLKVIQPVGAVDWTGTDDQIGWAEETTLDVEYAHAVAPGANILLVETPVSETEGTTGFPEIVQAEKYVIDHHLGQVISQSFSATEQTFPSRRSLLDLRGAYTDAARKGVTVLAATGDSGAASEQTDGSDFYPYPATTWPPSDPLVTAIGGTQLHLDAAGNHTAADTYWNDTFDTATQQFIFGVNGPIPLGGGGGKSVVFSRPSYQHGVRGVVGKARGVPDISMSGACNGAVDVYMGIPGIPAGWYPTCGTSEATPLFAGIVALSAQVAGHGLGPINPALYALSARHAPGIVDVTSGNSTVQVEQDGQLLTIKGDPATRGYDLTTGVGTVYAPYFVPELAAAASRH